MDHKTVMVDLCGIQTPVDSLIAADIAKLNARGFYTTFSCQGDDPITGDVRGGIAYTAFAIEVPFLCSVARAAGFHVINNTIYAEPSNHSDAVYDLATGNDFRRWNARFRLFLTDAGAGTLDATGVRYRIEWEVHRCVIREDGAYIDTALVPAYSVLAQRGVTISGMCAGDQTIQEQRSYTSARTRWTAPPEAIPQPLQSALMAIGFDVRPWGIFTLRGVRGSRNAGFVNVSPERFIAMNRVFKRSLSTTASQL